jgi:hypothetical protein
MSAQRRPPDVDDEFLTVAEVAAILKLNQQTIRNWTDQGSLPALCVAVACGSCAETSTSCRRRRDGIPRRPARARRGRRGGEWRDAQQFWGGE